MKRMMLLGLMAAPMILAPLLANASCSDRKATGTVVGGVGGALVGNSISHGGGGAILGGLGGAVLGHEVARDSCGDERRRAYPAHHHHRVSHPRPAAAPAPAVDQYGRPLQP